MMKMRAALNVCQILATGLVMGSAFPCTAAPAGHHFATLGGNGAAGPNGAKIDRITPGQDGQSMLVLSSIARKKNDASYATDYFVYKYTSLDRQWVPLRSFRGCPSDPSDGSIDMASGEAVLNLAPTGDVWMVSNKHPVGNQCQFNDNERQLILQNGVMLSTQLPDGVTPLGLAYGYGGLIDIVARTKAEEDGYNSRTSGYVLGPKNELEKLGNIVPPYLPPYLPFRNSDFFYVSIVTEPDSPEWMVAYSDTYPDGALWNNNVAVWLHGKRFQASSPGNLFGTSGQTVMSSFFRLSLGSDTAAVIFKSPASSLNVAEGKIFSAKQWHVDQVAPIADARFPRLAYVPRLGESYIAYTSSVNNKLPFHLLQRVPDGKGNIAWVNGDPFGDLKIDDVHGVALLGQSDTLYIGYGDPQANGVTVKYSVNETQPKRLAR